MKATRGSYTVEQVEALFKKLLFEMNARVSKKHGPAEHRGEKRIRDAAVAVIDEFRRDDGDQTSG